MISNFKKCLAIMLFAFAGCKTLPPADLVTVETFFRNSERTDYRISPNGKYLSFLQTVNGKQNLFVRSVADTLTQQITNLTDVSVKTYNWVGNQKLLCIKQKDSLNRHGAFLVDRDGTQQTDVESKPSAQINILNYVVHEENNVLITTNERDESFFDVYQLNILTGEKKLFVANPGNILLWYADDNGDVNLGVGGDGVNETIYFRRSADEKLMPIVSNNFKSSLKPIGFAKDKRYIYALSNVNRDKLALVELDCFTGKEQKVIYENADADILEVGKIGATGRPGYLSYEVDKRKTQFLDPAYKKMYELMLLELPDQEIEIVDQDSLAQNFIVKSYTDKNPGAYYIYSVAQKKLGKLSDVNPEIKSQNMCEMKPISYKTTDGLTIHGHLTLPLNKTAKNLPCVIIPHQGPSTRNVWGYQPQVQFLANRGYAVLQMNYRGSTGYGKAFQNAGFKQWGVKMQDDIFEGVAWLIEQGIADSTRIAAFGYGFGGYSALNQAISHPKTYKCVASYSGYINLFTYIKGFPAYYKPYKLMLNEMIGDPEADVDYLKKSSPVFQVEKVKVPILIAQGGKDSKVNVTETNQFVKELRDRNILVNYILNENETQLFKDPEHKLQFYTQLCSFLDKHLKNQ